MARIADGGLIAAIQGEAPEHLPPSVSTRHVVLAVVVSILLHGLILVVLSQYRPVGTQGQTLPSSFAATLTVGLGEGRAGPPAGAMADDVPAPSILRHPRAGAGLIAPPAPAGTALEQPHLPSEARHADFLAPNLLERSAVPRSEPNFSRLAGLGSTVAPIVVRIYVDEFGYVSDVEFLNSGGADADVLALFKKIISETRFLAGKQGGLDVRSYVDIEMAISDFAAVSQQPVR